jgi:hypothetical protein
MMYTISYLNKAFVGVRVVLALVASSLFSCLLELYRWLTIFEVYLNNVIYSIYITKSSKISHTLRPLDPLSCAQGPMMQLWMRNKRFPNWLIWPYPLPHLFPFSTGHHIHLALEIIIAQALRFLESFQSALIYHLTPPHKSRGRPLW